MTFDDLRRLFDYHYWARDRMLAALETLPEGAYAAPAGGSFGSIRETALHTMHAEWIWLERWQGTSPTAPPSSDGLDSPGALGEAWRGLEARVRAHLADVGEGRIDERVTYRNLAGVESTSPRWAMLQHVVNHASYHRGQIMTLVRQAGGRATGPQDLIAFYREQGV